jgi:tRNA nucleotidyltransferase (CCA-adding enzyme)
METNPLIWPTRVAKPGETIVNDITSEVLTLDLDNDETQLFASLCRSAKALEEGTVEGYPQRTLTVRVAGGWVRDKLLGISTHDVDIAVDTCTGVEFATIVQTVCAESCSGRMGVIAANPAQSKHLETATMKLHGIEVDFSNLRNETYANDSRIPTTAIGTPLEDAYRRDFTMNTLYYNLQTHHIEDWTRRGLRDLLETKVVHTPLDAHQTFHDDPLRVLRAIRFSVRFDMRLAEEVQTAARNPQIHDELHRKVSRERVGNELEGMLSGKHANPYTALCRMCELQLAGSVFCLPPESFVLQGTIGQACLDPIPYSGDDVVHLRQRAWVESHACLSTLHPLLATLAPSSDHTRPPASPVDTRLVYLATVLLPFCHLQYQDKTRLKPVVEYMIRDGIKFSNKDCISMVSLVSSINDMRLLLQVVPDATPALRLQAGLLLRNTKELWTTLLMVATVFLIRRTPEEECHWADRCRTWYKLIVQDLGLEGCWRDKPLMNGKELMQALSLNKGPQVGLYNQEQIQWMLMNPRGTMEECVLHLKVLQQKGTFEQDRTNQHCSKKVHL